MDHQSYKASQKLFTQTCEKTNESQLPASRPWVERSSKSAVFEKPQCRVLLKSPSGLCHITRSLCQMYMRHFMSLWGRTASRQTGRHIVCIGLGGTQTSSVAVAIIKRVPPCLYYTNVFSMVSVPCMKLKMSWKFQREEKWLQSSPHLWFPLIVSVWLLTE